MQLTLRLPTHKLFPLMSDLTVLAPFESLKQRFELEIVPTPSVKKVIGSTFFK
jgi:hypothetical protein